MLKGASGRDINSQTSEEERCLRRVMPEIKEKIELCAEWFFPSKMGENSAQSDGPPTYTGLPASLLHTVLHASFSTVTGLKLPF